MNTLKENGSFTLKPFWSIQVFDAANAILSAHIGDINVEELINIIIKYCVRLVDIQPFIRLHDLKTNALSWNLQKQKLRDQECEIIATIIFKTTTLQKLDFSSNNIRDGGARDISEALMKNRALQKLDLSRNIIRDRGARAISEVLMNNKTLTDLRIAYNKIADVGASAIAEALETNIALTELQLYHNQIGDVGATSIAMALKKKHQTN